ncbi:hypothetical protein CFP65_5279 [Kitasatospora sp. MMS16-BH015]|uniref:hypothetical protein n=1 Tax=Kitasatospora sp. MMS16-BH015 TaxID=2018025 RepID=UPI000CA36F03|nr:hypothetical protein [Kitasatospora sp. MMS16-BH015]AUG79988.1 hypothetical protein CFP65_5279 [Kitasatospora sp. MMS16-BH015]
MRQVRGAAKAVLALVAVAGVLAVLAWQLFWFLFDLNGPDFRDTGGAGLYWGVAKGWAVLAGCAALRQLGQEGSLRRMACWVLAMLLMPCWPVQAALVAVLVALRRAAGWRRWSAALAGALLLTGGAGWAATAYAAEQPWPGGPDSTLTGSWLSTRGGRLELRPDHTFTATVRDPDHDWAAWPGTVTGSWTVTADRLLVLTSAASSVELDPYGSDSPATLCGPIDWESPCASALHLG